MKAIQIFLLFIIGLGAISCKQKDDSVQIEKERPVWSADASNQWYAKQPWFRGSDFIPSTAINQLEMWQTESFDTVTLDRELGWAQDLGMNSMRVYLHHAVWEADSTGFFQRVEDYLRIADAHKISTLFVIFDDCWNPTYQLGKQPEPKTGIHNSGWVRDPGNLIHTDSTLMPRLEQYVKSVLRHFSDDKRIVLWDLYNEPGNSGQLDKSIPLLEQVFTWGRQVNPSQPLSVGYWNDDLKAINKIILENSDVITYHHYGAPEEHQKLIDTLRTLGRPLICTEYMARTRGSKFENIMPMLKDQKIGAYNWGFVAGKTNTIYAWDSPMPNGGEPAVWFHDILRKDGTPYIQQEVDLIRSLTAGQ